METNYKRYDDGYDNWYDYYNVTNYSGGYGTSPTVAVSPNRVHVGYNSYAYLPDTYYAFDEDEMSRTKYNTTWQTQQTIVSNGSARGKIFAASSKLYDFYYDFVSGMGQFHTDLYFKNRNYGSTTWSSSTLLEGFSDVTVPLVLCETANEYIHAFTPSGEVEEVVIINGSAGSPSAVSSGGGIYGFGTSSAHNDIYLVWKRGSNTYMEYRQYDADPETPQSFSVNFSGTNPILSWNRNKEPDINSYKIYKRVVGETGWACVATVSSSTSSWTDADVEHAGKFDPVYTIEYKMVSVDKSNNYSDYTDVIQIVATTNTLWKQAQNNESESITEYALYSNYPNPFNPSMTISYQLPKDGFVNLTVYNSLGQEVVVLVNSNQSSGKYSVQFNADNLPSGLYVYKLQSDEFHAVQKMMLTK